MVGSLARRAGIRVLPWLLWNKVQVVILEALSVVGIASREAGAGAAWWPRER